MPAFIGADSFQLTTAADAANTGKGFCVNPAASGIYMVVHGYKLSWKYGTSETTQPTLGLVRMIAATGAAAGTKRTSCRALTADGDSIGGVYDTIPTGVITTLGYIERFFAPASTAATSDASVSYATWQWFETPIVLVAQEFIAARQEDAGSAAEDRIVNLSWAWDEFTAPAGSIGLVRAYFGSRKR